MFNEPKSIPEDLILELEESIEKCLRLFGKVKQINEHHQDNEYRERNRDYEESIAL